MYEKDLLKDIRKYLFYAVELNLYLDNFPNNRKAIEDYEEISTNLSCLISEYEKKYGPLTNFGSAFVENPKAWVNNPWPWENC
ncbi:spore coat protein JB [Clostridium moniliforme]|uniref:Spore coat protein JB n=1 Tax=Clostridium moniliforme TaxID=39489 RepID=A0ABS4EZE2_9CLOT|nr:spore coat protein CotJB [Clostridium moniliforme]MBP1889364.1 spore coat protein JB [Clostridium moniliforme]